MEEIKTPIDDDHNQVLNTSRDTPPLPRCRAHLLFAFICFLTLVEALDATSIAVALPSIAAELGASATATYALGTSFLLASTIFQPAFSELSHVIGRKPALLLALVLFGVGSAVAGSSRSITWLLVGRSAQGVGAAGPLSLSIVILSDIFALRERAKWIGGLNGIWALGSITGPCLGGVFSQHASWRWVFWINLPPIGISLVGFTFLLDFDKREVTFWNALYSADWVGLALFLPSAAAFLIPLTFGGVIIDWSSSGIIVPLVLGVVGLAMLGYHQRYIAQQPLYRSSIFPTTAAVFGHLGAFTHGTLLCLVLYYLALFFEGVRGLSPVMTGVAALPGTLSVAPVAVAVGIIIARTGKYHWAVCLGWAAVVLGFGLFYLFDASLPWVAIVRLQESFISLLGVSWELATHETTRKISFVFPKEQLMTPDVDQIFAILAVGTGLGALIPALSMMVQASIQRKDAGHAVAFYYLIRSGGQCFGLAIGTAILSNQLPSRLDTGVDVDQMVTAESVIRLLNSLQTDSMETYTVKQALIGALRVVWITACAFAAVTGALCVLVKCPLLPEDSEDNE